MIVVKRNGETQKIAIAKIHKAVEWACNGLEVSLSEIETNAHIQFFDGIKTAQIHTALVNSAASLIDVGKTDYEFAAARLLLQQIYKEVTQHTDYPTLSVYISNAILLDKIKPEMQSFDLETLNAAIDVSRDDLFKYLGMQTVYDRYLLRDENQKLIEMPQHFWMRVAMGIALNETPETRTSWAIEFYNVLSKFEFVSSTPTLFNSGTKFSQMSSCFVTTTDDSIWEEQDGVNFGKGIFATMTECALYSKFAGGIGTDWTRVRPAGAGIGSTHGMSSGVVPYLKVFNDTAVSVNQGGKRNGSFAAYLEPWHGDIERFINLKKPNGDERLRAREIFPYIWANDLFMKRVKARAKWSLFCSHKNVELCETHGEEFERNYLAAEERGDAIKVIDAMELWKGIITALVESGAPLITFKDEHNRRNPQNHVGIIRSSNLCSEISLNTSDEESAVCNLGSINVSVCTQADFPRVIPIAMRMLDNVIDLNFYPTEKARRSNLKHRPVGLGLMGWTDYIISQGIDWESDEHLRLTDFVFEDFSYWAIKSSMEIAKEKGHYSSYEGSKWAHGILPIDTARQLPDEWRHGSRDAESWDTLRTEIQQHGMRNSNCMAIAPTACVTADTLVAGQNGLLRMDEIGDVNGEQWQAIDLVVNQQSANSPASKFYCNGVHNVRTITTANGHAVTGTDSHRLKVLSSANKLEWKFLKDIAVDDLVAHRLGGYEATEIQPIITLGEQGANSKETALPALLDKDMAVFLGAYMANGYVKCKTDGTPEGVKISLNENNVEFLDVLRNIGKAWGVYSADEHSQGVTTLCFYSVELGRLFVEELWTKPSGNNGEGAAGAFIPLKIRMSPRTIIAKFLQGLFTDGSLTFQERGSPVVEIGTVSETLASQLHALLWALGYMTKRIKSQPGSFGYRDVHRVRISNASHTVKFLSEVGWHSSEPLSKVSAYKCSERDSLRGLCVNGKKVITEVQALRGLSKFTKTFLATAKRQGHLSFHALEKLAIEYEDVKNTLAWQLMSEGILLLPVISNVPQKEAVPTFDIEVPNEHEYVANGMVNHNTIANIVGTTPCIEPIYKQVFVKENKSGKFKVVDPAMRHNRPELCKTAFEIDQSWLIKAAAVRQKYIDQSQSVNLFKRANVKGNVISDWYFLAWELGLKSTYYLKQQISELSYEEVIKEDAPAAMCSIDNPECESCQ